MPEPGDIVLIPFPFSDLSSVKKRPVLVLTAPDRHGDFIAVGITSVEQTEYAVTLDPDCLAEGRLPRTSWVRCDKVFTLSVDSIVKPFGTLRADYFGNVRKAVCRTLGCDSR